MFGSVGRDALGGGANAASTGVRDQGWDDGRPSACINRVGPVWPASGGLAERSLKPVAQTAVEAREEVAVAVEGEPNGGVTHGSWISFGCAPWAMSSAVQVCRRSWNRRAGGRPVRLTAGLKCRR